MVLSEGIVVIRRYLLDSELDELIECVANAADRLGARIESSASAW